MNKPLTPEERVRYVAEISIASEWAGFRETAIAPDAGDVQLQESRRAFYAGVFSVVMLMHAIGEPEITEEAGVEAIDRLTFEAIAFLKEVESGRA